MPLIYQSEVPDLQSCYVRDTAPTITHWQGQEALHLSGQGASLIILPNLCLTHGRIEVDIGTEGAAYAGVAFHIADACNFELVYAQPHTSDQWDALQYDPVFHGSNTWQLVHGPQAQMRAHIPPQTWFRLRMEFNGQQAQVRVGDQTPLTITQLAHHHTSGGVGLWTYLPAYFARLQIWDDAPDWSSVLFTSSDTLLSSIVPEWFMEGFGVIACEPGGILNLSRYLPVTIGEVHLVRWLETQSDLTLQLRFGYSDDLTLEMDQQVIFAGKNVYHNSPRWGDRGYVEAREHVQVPLAPGLHQLRATLRVTEPFGYGMILDLGCGAYRLLPVGLHPFNRD